MNILGVGKEAYKEKTTKPLKDFKRLTDTQYEHLDALVHHPNFTLAYMSTKSAALAGFVNWILTVYEAHTGGSNSLILEEL